MESICRSTTSTAFAPSATAFWPAFVSKRGGVILSPLADGPFGRFFVAGDPDGYAITFHTARS